MAVIRAVGHGVHTLARREFWTLKVIHALIGSLLTVAGASGGIFITDHIRKEILVVDGQIAENSHRTDSIERALAQFEMLQTEGFLLGALSAGETMRTELRKSFQDLGFVIRRGSVSRLIIELNAGNPTGLAADRAEQERLFDAAMAATELTAWSEVLRFETERQTKLRSLQEEVQATRAMLTQQRRGLETWLATATNWTFILQQLGFFVVLLAGLIYQHDHPALNPYAPARLDDTSRRLRDPAQP